MAPRVCLVLMIPVGFTLASAWGSQLDGPVLLLLWAFCMVWLWLVWDVHWKKNEPIGKTLGSIDQKLRYVIGTAILGYGLYNLVGGGPVTEKWLAAKITLYGLIIYNGIVLRKIAGNWQTAFDMIRAGGEQRVVGELQMKANRRRVEPPVLTIWALVAIMGFLLKGRFDELDRLSILLNRTREEVARDHITRSEFRADMQQLMDRFDRLERKIDNLRGNHAQHE